MAATVRTHPTEGHRQALDRDGDDVHEWMDGGYFLVHRWDAAAGKHVIRGTEMIGDDPKGGYFARFFHNAGSHPDYRLAVDGDTWTFDEPGTRATVAIAEEGACLEIAWPWRNDGSDWLPVCDLVSRRAG